jgi:hypothetical protein
MWKSMFWVLVPGAAIYVWAFGWFLAAMERVSQGLHP